MEQTHMTPEQYIDAIVSLPDLRRPRVSRDGRWVAWTWYRTGPAADVYAVDTSGSGHPLRLTQTAEDTVLVSWSPDSQAIVVAQDRGGDERLQLFRVSLDRPREMVPLTGPEPNYYIRGGDLHPNGRWLVYGANVDPATGKEIEATWMIRHDLDSGERHVLARPEKEGYVWPQLSPTGDHVLYGRMDRHPAGYQMWLVDIEGQNDREILNEGPERKVLGWWFPDGKRVLVVAETATHQRVGVYDIESDALGWLVDDPTRTIEKACAPFGSAHVLLVEIQGARQKTSLLNPDTREEQPLSPVAGNLLPLAPVPGDQSSQLWLARYDSSTQPGDLVRLDLDRLEPNSFQSLTRVWDRTALTPQHLIPAQDFHWTSVDELQIQGWLYQPPGEPRGTVVFVHGGPTSHSRNEIRPLIQVLAYHGFVVLAPNYRGSTGFGLAFREAIKVQGWGGLEQEDIRTGIQALVDAGISQPGQIGITGTSYGGYSAWCAATRWPRDIVAAAVPICGMTDLVVDYETTRPDLRPYSAEMMGGAPEENPERFRERSPIHFVHAIESDLLIVQGARDPNVTPDNVRAVERALLEAHVPYRLLTFDDEGHGIQKPENQNVLYQRIVAFFDQAFQKAAAIQRD